ncbi:PDZ domain-containing protein [Thermoflexus sp.]|uniref:PDZ domain-containing protein n=1 Tax=Thermoflexus sp. TaxID=1969742 RepID=UPI0025E48976|nr:PDZ domain-containing protein [Thermoflexus sp.]MCS6963609.1 PDZ domain-containing protein [Thermoflexus sp.]MCX7691011.1 PDZ domain-containing protein [Thermoflexus sp.]MDW8184499.1 PDZ domain-containing protein [Anaerolineae bacterium]
MRRWVWIGLGGLGIIVLIGGALGIGLLLSRGIALARGLGVSTTPVGATPTPGAKPGVVIIDVEPGGPADRAGLTRGDILLEISGQPVGSLSDLRSILSRYRPGDTVTVVVQHGDERRTRTVTLGDRNGQAYLGVMVAPEPGSPMFRGRPPFRGWGLPWGRIRPPAGGVLILSVERGSPAERAGLRPGDWITAVDGQALSSDEDLGSRIAARRPGDSVRLTIWRPAEGEQIVTVTLGEHPQKPGQAYLGVRYSSFRFRLAPRISPTPTPSGGGT